MKALKKKKSTLEKRLETLEARVRELQSELYITTDARLDEAEKNVKGLQVHLADVKEGLGGAIWRTQQGHARFIALLSMSHLRNLAAWDRTPDDIRAKVKLEIQRREIDVAFRQAGVPASQPCAWSFQSQPPQKVLQKHSAVRENARAILKILGG